MHPSQLNSPTIIQKYWPLIKSSQTLLLLATGLAGYMSARCPISHWFTVLSLTGSLFLAISGSTILNMWYDRDIDAKMARTRNRPLPSGSIKSSQALSFGLALSGLGIGWALLYDPLYGAIVFAGLFFDVIVYTIWLKRKTAWSIVWGGLSGGMPILAGRILGTGKIEWVGIILALSVLFWIPTHIMTFHIRYLEDYKKANIPTFAARYGIPITRRIIAISSIIAASLIGISAIGIGITIGYFRIIVILSAILLGLSIYSALKPTDKLNYALFKYASVFMLSAMVLISI